MAMTTLYSAAVGPIGNDYYLPLFSRFEAAGQATLSWNLSACLYSINWMIFRRLWGPAGVFAGAMLGALLLAALGLLVFAWPPELIWQLLLACLALGMLACGLWGNALLYRRCRRAMMTAVAENKTLVQACAQLSQTASTRRRFIRVLLANALLLALAGVIYLQLVGFGHTTTPAPEAAPAPALAASAIQPVASAPSQTASAALAPASAISTPLDASALVAAAAASATSDAPASVPASAAVSASSSAPVAVSASASAAVPASASMSTHTVRPITAVLPVHSSVLAASPSVPAHPQPAASALKHAASPARGRSAAPAATHTSAATHAVPKPAAHAAPKPVAKPAAKVTITKAPKSTPLKASHKAAAASAPAPVKGIYINAGLFADPDNAHNALAKLQAAGLPALAQELATSKGPRTRIRVGPIANLAQAEATIQKIKALNLDAALVKP